MAPMQDGLLEILRLIVKQPTEGWKSLFKGNHYKERREREREKKKVTWFLIEQCI